MALFRYQGRSSDSRKNRECEDEAVTLDRKSITLSLNDERVQSAASIFVGLDMKACCEEK